MLIRPIHRQVAYFQILKFGQGNMARVLAMLSLFLVSVVHTSELKTENTYLFSIPRQELSTSLHQLSDVTETSFLFAYNLTQEKVGNPVKGKYSVQTALNILLKDTGLTGKLSDKQVFVIVPEAQSLETKQIGRKDVKTNKSALALIIGTFFGANSTAQEMQIVAKESNDIEVIVVEGIQGSLGEANRIKRLSNNIVDSIIAEDIGKLPDINVAEALQRIPGVTVERDSGEGRRISVRGLDGSFNVTTLNGRRLASEDIGREFSYDVLASELVSRIDVNKSSQASLYEGGIGAIVDIRTLKPLSLTNDTMHFSATGVWDELADETNPRLSAVFSKQLLDNSLGVLVSANYNKRALRQEEAKVTEYDKYYNVDLYQDGSVELNNGTIPRAFTLVQSSEERERYGGTIAVQWQPSDKFELSLDALYSVYNTTNNQNVFANVLDQSNPNYYEEPTSIDFKADNNGNILGLTWGDDNLIDGPYTRSEFAFVENEVSTFPRKTKTLLIGSNAKYHITDNFTTSLDVYYSEAKREDSGDGWVLKARTAVNTASFDWSEGREFPELSFSETPGTQFPWTVGYLENRGTDVEDSILEAKIDNVYYRGEFIEELRFGAGISKQEKKNDVYRTTAIDTYFEGKAGDDYFGLGEYSTNIDGLPFTLNVDAISPIGDSGFDYERFRSFVIPDDVFTTQITDFLSSSNSTGIPRSWSNLGVGDMLQWLKNVGKVADGDNSDDFDLLSASLSPVESYSVEETTSWAYVEADIEGTLSGINYFMNVGVRLANTKQVSNGSNADVKAFYGRFLSDILGVEFESPTAISQEKTYTSILPSLNIKFVLTKDLVGRFSAAKVMSRAPIGDLRLALDQPNFRGGTIRAGQPDLEPFKANQYDVTLEWYYGEKGALLFGAFYKDIDTFIANGERTDTLTLSGPFTCTVNFCTPGQSTSKEFNLFGPFNAQGGSIEGIELSWQQGLGEYFAELDGLGFVFNTTYADSSTELEDGVGNKLPLEGQSEWSYNLIGYYENDRIGIRFAYNWRDQYLLVSGQNPVYHDPIGWLDTSLYYNINENVTVNLYGSNLLDSESKGTYGKESGPFNDYMNFVSYTGRQVGVGVRIKI
jgi:iron complex outermembrane receptor protein